MQCIIAQPPAPESIIPSPLTANPLLRYRLRWYAVSTARLLLRRWQALVLLVGVLASANASIFSNLDTFAHPVLLLVAPGHGPAWRCCYLVFLLALASLWAHMQRAQIGGGDFMAFAGSLPLAARLRRRVDLAVLLLADSPLLLMVAGALMSTAARAHAPAQLPQLLLLAALVPLALAVQLAVLDGRPTTAVAAIVGRLRLPAWPGRRLLPALAGRHTPALRIAFAVLLRERRNEALAKAAGAAALIAAAIALAAVFEHDARAIAAAGVAQGLVALHLSGLFRGLQMAHQAAAAYTGALPLAPRWWRRVDLAAVLVFGLPFLAALALLAWIEGASAARALAGLLSYAALLCALRAPQLFSERHAVVFSTLLAASWMALTIAYLT